MLSSCPKHPHILEHQRMEILHVSIVFVSIITFVQHKPTILGAYIVAVERSYRVMSELHGHAYKVYLLLVKCQNATWSFKWQLS